MLLLLLQGLLEGGGAGDLPGVTGGSFSQLQRKVKDVKGGECASEGCRRGQHMQGGASPRQSKRCLYSQACPGLGKVFHRGDKTAHASGLSMSQRAHRCKEATENPGRCLWLKIKGALELG